MARVPVIIYTTPNCVQCNMTKREFDKAGIIYEVVDLSTNPKKTAEFKELGYLAAPIVTTDIRVWSGFKLPKIRSLIDYIHSLERGEK